MPDLRLTGFDAGVVLCGPDTLHFDLTNACNTACITCWDHSPLLRRPRPPAWKRQRADLAAVLAVIDDAASLGGLRNVILSGMGEPFTHPGIYEIIAKTRARGIHVCLITNLLAADPDRLLKEPPDELLIGVHAVSGETYRAFHGGPPDGWECVLDHLARLRAAGRRTDKIVNVICAVNAAELPEMVRFARDLGEGRVSFKLANLGGGTERCAIGEKHRKWLIDHGLPRARELAVTLGVETNLDVFERQLGCASPTSCNPAMTEIGCFMGWSYARILVDGTVLYCCATEARVGSLAEGRFSELWHGTAWNALRLRLRRGEFLPACGRCGKLAQNMKLSRRFAAVHGTARLHAILRGEP